MAGPRGAQQLLPVQARALPDLQAAKLAAAAADESLGDDCCMAGPRGAQHAPPLQGSISLPDLQGKGQRKERRGVPCLAGWLYQTSHPNCHPVDLRAVVSLHSAAVTDLLSTFCN